MGFATRPRRTARSAGQCPAGHRNLARALRGAMVRATDWRKWLRRWDAQQERFNPDRERRFSAMFDVLEAAVRGRRRVLDLGCGPGSLSARLLRRFPRATSVAVDYDPVVLRVGRGALGTCGGRLTWVDAKLGAPDWSRALPRGRFDAALSTTALHWLGAPELRQLYADLARRIRPGGLVLNGDRLAWGSRDRTFDRIATSVRRLRFGAHSSRAGWRAWREWWERAERDPALRPLFAERARRHAQHPTTGDLSLEVHVRALRRAGFRAVGIVWANLDDRVLCAVR
jgi:SAM-dependent methyltransferase